MITCRGSSARCNQLLIPRDCSGNGYCRWSYWLVSDFDRWEVAAASFAMSPSFFLIILNLIRRHWGLYKECRMNYEQKQLKQVSSLQLSLLVRALLQPVVIRSRLFFFFFLLLCLHLPAAPLQALENYVYFQWYSQLKRMLRKYTAANQIYAVLHMLDFSKNKHMQSCKT